MALYDLNKMKADYLTPEYRRKVATGDNLTLARLEVKQGAVTQPHCHDHEEVILLLKGSWRFQLPTGTVTLFPNQVLTIPRGVEHSSEVLEDVIAIDVCTPQRKDWISGEDRRLHAEADEGLWAV
jgi:quercetin dioxygenase-like cupin family protein